MFDPWVGKTPWRRKWLPTPVFQYSCLDPMDRGAWGAYSPWGLKESDTIEWLIHTHIFVYIYTYKCFPGGSAVKNLLVMQEMQETRVLPLVWEDPLEKGMTTHSSILAWRIPWTEEPGGLQSMGSQRVIQDWAQAWPWRLADIHYYMWNRWITRTYWITQGTIFNIL